MTPSQPRATIELPGAKGTSILNMERVPGGIQINVLAPAAGGAALFVVYPDTFTDQAALDGIAQVLDQGPLEAGRLDVPGALAAGAVNMPTAAFAPD